ncbi:MAG: hypothetical protein NT045_05270, partial [Candidatus Aureabacteria bacterium]|nr:hypothetical protein [Candidatus Auribacterota bacterium]
MSTTQPSIKAHILLFYCFELAYSVRVDKLEELLKKQPTEGVVSMRRSRSHYLRFASYPLIIKLGEDTAMLGDSPRTASAQARVFDFGVVSLCLRIPFSGTLNELALESTAISESGAFAELAQRYLQKIKRLVAPALHRPIESDLVEDYVIFHLSEIAEPLTGEEFLKKYAREITMIIRAERRPLSDQEVENAISNSI